MSGIQSFTEEELQSTYSEILSSGLLQLTPVKKPIGFILGGQPGAGKTTLHQSILNQTSKNVFIIYGDNYRHLHPRFDEIQRIYKFTLIKVTMIKLYKLLL